MTAVTDQSTNNSLQAAKRQKEDIVCRLKIVAMNGFLHWQ
jgi:hypothetical protein